MKALVIANCSKTYKNGHKALHNLSMSVAEGDFYALLGPNGAGKTTLIGIICSTIAADHGDIDIFEMPGKNFWQVKQLIGVMPQEVNFNIFQNPVEILVNNAGLYGIDKKTALVRAESLLKKLNIWDKKHKAVRELSGGYKRRLMLARAMMHKPKILLLDEPTAGVDIETRESTWEFLRAENKKGTTIILTTHYLEEAEKLCNRVTFIDNGCIVASGVMANMLSTLCTESFILECLKEITTSPKITGAQCKTISPHTLELTIAKGTTIASAIIALVNQGIEITTITNKRGRLEELFLNLTKKQP